MTAIIMVYSSVMLLSYVGCFRACFTGWFRLNAKNCVPGKSSRRFFELDHKILHTYSGRQYLKLEEGGFLIWGFMLEPARIPIAVSVSDHNRKHINSLDAVIHVQKRRPQKWFLVGCSSRFMRLV